MQHYKYYEVHQKTLEMITVVIYNASEG